MCPLVSPFFSHFFLAEYQLTSLFHVADSKSSRDIKEIQLVTAEWNLKDAKAERNIRTADERRAKGVKKSNGIKETQNISLSQQENLRRKSYGTDVML